MITTPERIEEIGVCGATYRLLAAAEGWYDPGEEVYEVSGFEPVNRGRGRTVEGARNDWMMSVHAEFQRLYAMRPIDISDEDRVHWDQFCNHIDIADYINRAPLQVRRIGQIRRQGNAYAPYLVRWSDGSTEEIDINRVPALFAGFALGQWFEAVLSQDRRTGALREMTFASPTASRQPMSDGGLELWLSELPTAETLPDSDYDWTSE